MLRVVPLCLLLASAAFAQTDEFIYEKASFPSAHASTIVELKNGHRILLLGSAFLT